LKRPSPPEIDYYFAAGDSVVGFRPTSGSFPRPC
jgi:hypothetical protein